MNKIRYFHGSFDTDYATIGLGRWRVTNVERLHAHVVKRARNVLYRFHGHTHPYAQRLIWELISTDISGLQQLDTEIDLRRPYFRADYMPEKVVEGIDPAQIGNSAVAVLAMRKPGSTLPDEGLPVHDLDFDYQSGAYAVYNWEVFYHVPFIIALHLSKNGRYAESQRWFHYIFDPTDNSDPKLGPQRFWKVKPFKIDEVDHIEQVLFNVATGDDPIARDSTVRAIGAWRDRPFRPHLVARSRPSAYMYATVMAYLDNLIAWGDSLFRQDTRESINEAMQLYVLAANILGPRPQVVPRRGTNKKQTYATLKNNLDEFGNAAVRLEAEIAFDLFPPPLPSDAKPEQVVLESVGRSLYFCVPHNEKLVGYWDTVADRLFKIRNSLNLQGVFRQLPLFAPPIDPAVFARAVAAGVDVSAIVDGTAGAIAPVRFPFLLQKAMELTQEVKSLGGQILAAIEKKDNETLGVLRAKHEVNMLGLADAVRYAQWQEAIKAREGIQVNIANAFQRYRHYDRLLGTEDGQIKLPEYVKFDRQQFETRSAGMEEPSIDSADPEVRIGSSVRDGGHKVNDEEAHELDLLEAAEIAQEIATAIQATGSFLNLIPNIEASAKPWGLGAGIKFGGSNLGMLFQALSIVAQGVAGRIRHESALAGRMGGFARREQDWAFQRKAAAGELTQLFKQLRSAEIREYIAKREHEHHAKQMQQSKEVLEFLTNEENQRTGTNRKTTTEDFYLWMKREAQGLHAKCFQFAFDIAKKAERAFQHELGDTSASYIKAGYLAGREGLFAGEKLFLDLKRMDMAYVELNTREFEITKHISLRDWFPLQLLELRASGKCEIAIPEAAFDLDCPGHYFRRIKTVAVSIPCVTGPYASLNCAVMLTGSHVRTKATALNNQWYPADLDNPDTERFTVYPAATSSIVTSTGQNDTGMFDSSMRDERYLPFEGAGVISKWAIELLGKPRQFDWDTVADVVFTIRYTARPGAAPSTVTPAVEQWLKEHSARLFSMRHEFPSEWARFKKTTLGTGETASIAFDLTDSHFPYRLQQTHSNARRVHVFGRTESSQINAKLLRGTATIGETTLAKGEGVIVPTAPIGGGQPGFDPRGRFDLQLDSTALDDLWLVVDWSQKAP